MSARNHSSRISQWLLWGGVAVLLFSAAVLTLAQPPKNILKLITDQDVLRQDQTAKEKGLTEVGRSMILELKDGPEIDVVRPGGGEIGQQPVEIDVEFKQSKDGADPNMSTLKVRYIKFFTIDITDRVKPFIMANRIHASQAAFPKGDHTVELYVEDTQGKASSKVIEFKVL
jgi:hypothetical protein